MKSLIAAPASFVLQYTSSKTGGSEVYNPYTEQTVTEDTTNFIHVNFMGKTVDFEELSYKNKDNKKLYRLVSGINNDYDHYFPDSSYTLSELSAIVYAATFG